MRLTATDVQDYFDQDGRSAGVYAIELREPSSDMATLLVEWQAAFDADPPEGFLERLSNAERFIYVGSHGKSVYGRVCQHARGEKSSTIMDVWEPRAVHGYRLCDDPAEKEWGLASELSDGRTVCWCDGDYI